MQNDLQAGATMVPILTRMWLWWWTLVAQTSIVRFMNPLVAHLLAAMLADAADQLSGTPPNAQISVADRTVSCCGGSAAGGR